MLRIMNPGAEIPQGPPPPDPTAPPDAPPTDQAPPDPTDPAADPIQPDPGAGGGKIPQMLAGYMPPEMGPFVCSGCKFFITSGACQVVNGPIDPSGCCNNFCPAHVGAQAPETESPAEDTTEPQEEPGDAPPLPSAPTEGA